MQKKKSQERFPTTKVIKSQWYNSQPQNNKRIKRNRIRKDKAKQMSSNEFCDRMNKAFNPKQWRKELYDYHKTIEGEYPTHQHVKDKKDLKYTTYYCGEWVHKVRNPKKDTTKKVDEKRHKHKPYYNKKKNNSATHDASYKER